MRWPLALLWLTSACSLNFGSSSYSRSLAPEFADKSAHERVPVHGLRNIQRSLRMMSTSTSAQHNHVRVLFYGQSITQSAWSHKVALELSARFPLADLEIENRAIGGFASNLLVKTAETDLYSYYPDLVIFHAYGAHDRYEDIVRRLRERTTAEIVLQTDHVLTQEDLVEQTEPSQLSAKPEIWNAFMNNAFLPALAERYQTELCDVRSAWKQHLRERADAPDALLKDGLHLNSRGDALMAAYVEQCLKNPSELAESPAEAWVRTYTLGRELSWAGDELELAFEGNRVDAIVTPGQSGSVDARIDGQLPSARPELYGFGRALCVQTGAIPVLLELSSAAPLLLELFTLEVAREGSGEDAVFTFSLRGSKTGADGTGSSRARFESSSRRVIIDPEDWNVLYAFQLAGRSVPEHFAIELRVEPRFTDSYSGIAESTSQRATGRLVTLAQGLRNGKHTLRLQTRDPMARYRLRAVRVYQPPLARE